MSILIFIALFIAIGGLCDSVAQKKIRWIWIWSGVLTYDIYGLILEVIKNVNK